MSDTDPVALYRRFLDAFNKADYDEVARVVADSFEDHHPGFAIHGRDAYLAALRDAHRDLEVRGDAEEILVSGDRIITRVWLTGRHVGTVLGVPPSGGPVSWGTIEIWRVSDGRLAERWAQDDLWGLRRQLSPDEANLRLVRQVSDAVNARRLDDLDDLFAPSFTDHNPAWSVRGLDELKSLIRATQEALDFTAHVDALYPAEGNRVIMHITFTGRHVGPLFDRQPTGAEVTWTSLEVYRVHDDRVAERWVQADTAGLMRQLGVALP